MKLGVVVHVRDASGVIHRLEDGKARCGVVLEPPLRELAEIPEECSEDALCRECWPRWPGDCLEAVLG